MPAHHLERLRKDSPFAVKPALVAIIILIFLQRLRETQITQPLRKTVMVLSRLLILAN